MCTWAVLHVVELVALGQRAKAIGRPELLGVLHTRKNALYTIYEQLG